MGLALSITSLAKAELLRTEDPIRKSYFKLQPPTVREVSEAEWNRREALSTLSIRAASFQKYTQEYYKIFDEVTSESSRSVDRVEPNPELVVAIEEIINLGKKIWEIVEAGRPVVDVKTDVADALPKGIENWGVLENWRTPISKTYEVEYKNLLGMKVVRFSYRILYTYGGSYQGKGQYLTRITVVPADLYVAWGFNFSATAQVPSVTNAGTNLDPLAAAELLVKWSIDNPINHAESTESYYVRGDGILKDLN